MVLETDLIFSVERDDIQSAHLLAETTVAVHMCSICVISVMGFFNEDRL